MEALFTRISNVSAKIAGHYTAFIVAVLLVVLWGVSGPFLAFSATWQLIANTATTLITFLLLFLVQGTQNRDTKAIHIKLDRLLDDLDDTDERIVEAENQTEAEMEEIKEELRSKR